MQNLIVCRNLIQIIDQSRARITISACTSLDLIPPTKTVHLMSVYKRHLSPWNISGHRTALIIPNLCVLPTSSGILCIPSSTRHPRQPLFNNPARLLAAPVALCGDRLRKLCQWWALWRVLDLSLPQTSKYNTRLSSSASLIMSYICFIIFETIPRTMC